MYYENVLSDYGYTPKYKCYVCDSIGLVFKQGEAGKDIPVNVCHNCGYFCRGERDYADEKIWRDAWKENGSIKLFDLPLQENVADMFSSYRDISKQTMA